MGKSWVAAGFSLRGTENKQITQTEVCDYEEYFRGLNRKRGRLLQSPSWVAAGFSLRLKTLKINKKQITQTEVCGYEEKYFCRNFSDSKRLIGGEV